MQINKPGGLQKSGYLGDESRLSAVSKRDTDYWGPPKVPIRRKIGKALALTVFVATWIFVIWFVVSS